MSRYPDHMHITNAIPLMPPGPERDEAMEKLIEDVDEMGSFARFRNIEHVRDLRTQPLPVSGRTQQWIRDQIGGVVLEFAPVPQAIEEQIKEVVDQLPVKRKRGRPRKRPLPTDSGAPPAESA